MTADLNKKISLIKYNSLHLPLRIEHQDGHSADYVYDASGVKLQMKNNTVGMALITKDYRANKVYENTVLKMILTEDGYVEPNSGSFNYYFFIKDHLGNNRVVADKNGTVAQITNYYPFGMSHAEVPARNDQHKQPYKFNGKELDRMFGLDTYDYSARMYSPAIGRFMTMDPLAEKYYSVSPYAYCANNPVNAYDLHGDSIWYTKDDNVITMHVTGKVINQSSDNINVGRAASDITSGINDSFSGTVEYGGQTYTLQTDIQLEAVTSMDDVAGSDHLFVLADSDGKSARGATNMNGGKVMTIAASDYANDNWFSNTFSSNNTRTAVHEFGHAAGLTQHPMGLSNVFNLMKQGGFGSSVSPSQRTTMINSWNKINRGSNSYMGQPYPFVHDPKTGQVYRASDLLNWNKRYGKR